MFCPNCGANIPDNSICCSSCGVRVAASGAPAASAVPAGLSKSQYLASYASPKTKTLGLASWGAAALCVILLIVSYVSALNTSVEDLPIIRNLAGVIGEDVSEFKEIKSDMLEDIEYVEDVFDDYEDDLTSKEKEVCKEIIDASKDFARSISINNTKKMIKVFEDFTKLDFDDAKSVERAIKNGIGDGVDEVKGALNIFSAIILWFMFLPLVLTALGGIFRISGLVIAGLVFLLFYGLTFCPIVLLILLIAIHAALIYITGKIHSEYKAYQYAAYRR